MTVMELCRCLLGSVVVLQNAPAKKDLTSHPEPSAQLGVGSVHVDAFRPTAPLTLAVAPAAILDHLCGAVFAHLKRLVIFENFCLWHQMGENRGIAPVSKEHGNSQPLRALCFFSLKLSTKPTLRVSSQY